MTFGLLISFLKFFVGRPVAAINHESDVFKLHWLSIENIPVKSTAEVVEDSL